VAQFLFKTSLGSKFLVSIEEIENPMLLAEFLHLWIERYSTASDENKDQVTEILTGFGVAENTFSVIIKLTKCDDDADVITIMNNEVAATFVKDSPLKRAVFHIAYNKFKYIVIRDLVHDSELPEIEFDASMTEQFVLLSDNNDVHIVVDNMLSMMEI